MVKYLGKTITFADSTATLAEVKEISGFAPSADELETTVHSSSYWRTHMAGLKDGGTVDVTVYYDGADASMNRLITRFNSDPTLNTDTYTVTFPDAKTVIFTGIITNVPYETPVDENMTVTFTFRISGAITGTLGT